MSNEPTDVMIGAYMDMGPAKADYQAVIDSGVKIEGAVCVSRNHAGKLAVEETGHMAKKGTEVLGGVGLVVGLFAPPLLLATAIGAAVGAGVGDLVHSEVKSKIEQQAFETIPYGGAGLIIAYPHSSADGVDKSLASAFKEAVGEADGKRVDALKKALAEAQEKMK